MTKKFEKHPRQNEKVQESCTWSWMNIFSFRRGQKTRKQISNRRHGSAIGGTGYLKSDTELLNEQDGSVQATTYGCKTAITGIGKRKPSVEVLTEEDVSGVQNKDKEPNLKALVEEDTTNEQDKDKHLTVKVLMEEEVTVKQNDEMEHSVKALTEGNATGEKETKEPKMKVLAVGEATGEQINETEPCVKVSVAEEMTDKQNKEDSDVKILVKERMNSKQDKEKGTSNSTISPEESNSVGGQITKNKKKKKSWRKGANKEIHDSSTIENLRSDCSCTRNSGRQLLKDVKIENMMEEFFRQVHQKSISRKTDDQNGDGIKLGESIKEFINQKLEDCYQCCEDGRNDLSEELVDAFEILSLEEELFLRLIQDPDSPLKKCARHWKNALTDKEQKSDFLAESNFSELKVRNLRKTEDLADKKQGNVVSRMVKYELGNLLTGDKSSHVSNRVVIFKPHSTSSPRSKTESGLGSSLASHDDVRKKNTDERVSSYFFFTKLGGILRKAIRRERNERPSVRNMNTSIIEHHNLEHRDETTRGGNTGKRSPRKDHSFAKKVSKPRKENDSCSEEKDCGIVKEQGAASNHGKKESKINIKARRQLSKRLCKKHGDETSSTQEVTKTLDKILSEQVLSSINSPRKDSEQLDVPLKNSMHDKAQMVNKNTQRLTQEEDCHPGQSEQLKDDSCVPVENRDSKLQPLDPTPNIADELTCDSRVETTCLTSKKECKIITRAKKQLSKRLSKRREHESSSTQHVTETLGRILSFSEYNSSPTNGPKRDSAHSFDIPSEKFQMVEENMQKLEEEKDGQLGQSEQLSLGTAPNITEEHTCDNTAETTCSTSKKESKINIKAKKHLSRRLSKRQEHEDSSGQQVPEILGKILSLPGCYFTPSICPKDELDFDNRVEIVCPHTNKTSYKGDLETSEATKDDHQDYSNQLYAPGEPSNYSAIGDCQREGSPEEVRVQSPKFSSPSSPSFENKDHEQAATANTQEKPRPTAQLEHSSQDNEVSPATIVSQHDKDSQSKISFEVKESIFEYVNALLQASHLELDELYMNSLSSDHRLDLSLYDEIETPAQLNHDPKLLFDVANKVLMEVHESYFRCSPLVSFIQPSFQPLSNMKSVVIEVWKGVCWYLYEVPLPCTVEKIIRRDMARNGSWLDLRYDAEGIGIRVEEAILDELVEDTILNCLSI